jgi:hypothetical protein
MTNKDEASPRQRQIMEQRWAKAREDCPAGTCTPVSRFHIAGCERRQQKIKVTNQNTGVVSEATIDHGDFRAVKEVLDQHEKQAVRMEPIARAIDLPDDGGKLLIPAGMDFDQEYWSQFERGMAEARPPARGYGSPDVSVSYADSRRSEAPARPWWKFWGRRG